MSSDVLPGRPRRPKRFWIGVGMILAGLGILAWLLWQFFGTNWVSHRAQRQLTQEFESGQTLHTRASALIRIPKFGKDYVVPILEGTTPELLAEGFGHFTQTAGPGQIGNFAVAGHRVTHGEPLRRMPELRPGDSVYVETRKVTYHYELTTNPNDLVVPFTSGWVLDPLPHNPNPGGAEPAQKPGQRLITLTTCSEIFHTDNRMIAFGVLIDSRPTAPQ